MCGTPAADYQDCEITVDDGGQPLTEAQQASVAEIQSGILAAGAALAAGGTAAEIEAWESVSDFSINPNTPDPLGGGAAARATGATINSEGTLVNPEGGIDIYSAAVDVVSDYQNNGELEGASNLVSEIVFHEVEHFSADDVANRTNFFPAGPPGNENRVNTRAVATARRSGRHTARRSNRGD